VFVSQLLLWDFLHNRFDTSVTPVSASTTYYES